jgi:hypothetical protein
LCRGSHLGQEFAKVLRLVEAHFSEEGGAAKEELDGIFQPVERTRCKRHQSLPCTAYPQRLNTARKVRLRVQLLTCMPLMCAYSACSIS